MKKKTKKLLIAGAAVTAAAGGAWFAYRWWEKRAIDQVLEEHEQHQLAPGQMPMTTRIYRP